MNRASTPSRRGASSTAWLVSWCPPCCGRRWPEASPPDACSPLPCASLSSASARSALSSPKSTGKYTRIWQVAAWRQSASRCSATTGEISDPLDEEAAMAAAAMRCPRLPGQQARGQAHAIEACRAVYYLDAAAGRQYPAGLQRQEDHDAGPAPLRGRLHHLHANRLHQPQCGCGRRLPQPHRRELPAELPAGRPSGVLLERRCARGTRGHSSVGRVGAAARTCRAWSAMRSASMS